jgi:hypothetical protein
MYSLDKVLVEQIKREFKRETATADAEEVRQASQKYIKMVSEANLCALEISRYLKRIVNLYCYVATAKIATGTVTEEWTRQKKLAAHYLEYLAEKVLERGPKSGEIHKSDFMTDLRDYENEYLTSVRKDFSDKHNNWLPPEGNFEKIYIPMIKICIESIYRIYSLYQIDNMTHADLRNPNLEEETLKLLPAVHCSAQDRVIALLEPLNMKNLEQAVKILDSIEKAHASFSVMSAAAKISSTPLNQHSVKIDMTRYLTVDGAFAIELDKRDKLDEDAALRNIGTLAKRGVAAAAGMAGTASNIAVSGAAYLSEKAMDLLTGPMEGEKARLLRLRRESGYDTEDEEDEEDEDDYDVEKVKVEAKGSSDSSGSMPTATKLDRTPPPSYEALINWEYETNGAATTNQYRPSISTASTVSNENTADRAKTPTFELT